MKKYSAPLVVLIASLLLAGCESSGTSARIQEKSAIFNNLAPWQQRDIQAGIVGIGYSIDMVYMALGNPSKIVTTANGTETVWTYNNYYPPSAQHHSQMNLDTTGNAKYTSSQESANSPNSKKSLLSTGSGKGDPQTSLDVADMPSDTLYVIFREGEVFQTKLESEGK